MKAFFPLLMCLSLTSCTRGRSRQSGTKGKQRCATTCVKQMNWCLSLCLQEKSSSKNSQARGELAGLVLSCSLFGDRCFSGAVGDYCKTWENSGILSFILSAKWSYVNNFHLWYYKKTDNVHVVFFQLDKVWNRQVYLWLKDVSIYNTLFFQFYGCLQKCSYPLVFFHSFRWICLILRLEEVHLLMPIFKSSHRFSIAFTSWPFWQIDMIIFKQSNNCSGCMFQIVFLLKVNCQPSLKSFADINMMLLIHCADSVIWKSPIIFISLKKSALHYPFVVMMSEQYGEMH